MVILPDGNVTGKAILPAFSASAVRRRRGGELTIVLSQHLCRLVLQCLPLYSVIKHVGQQEQKCHQRLQAPFLSFALLHCNTQRSSQSFTYSPIFTPDLCILGRIGRSRESRVINVINS